ncbi:MAG: 50S ribosomal protein L9 [Spirochaetaceae bacterium]|nr:MAG: 50S ribosomal protein L9 [Spirochaetaceae bacterium]
MKVILNVDIANLGEEGDVCEVKPGYARNYLLPRGMVLLDNTQNRALLESRRSDIEKRRQQKADAARSQREKIEAEPLVIAMPAGENGRLFGSVTPATIVEQLDKAGMSVEKRNIDVPEKTIKTLGTYKVRVKLYGEEEAQLTVQVIAAGKASEETKQKPTPTPPAPEAAVETAPEASSDADEVQTPEAESAETDETESGTD